MISEHVPSLMLTYCPKRIGYINDRFAARHVLAFLDHNHHLNRGQLLRKDGSSVFVGHYGKRTKQWYAVPIPAENQHAHAPGTFDAFRRKTLLALGSHV